MTLRLGSVIAGAGSCHSLRQRHCRTSSSAGLWPTVPPVGTCLVPASRRFP